MMNYARALFGFSAALNFAVGAALLLLRPWLLPLLQIAPQSNPVLLNFAATMIILFGYAYVRIAADPIGFRPLIHVMAIGKLLAFASAAWPFAWGAISARLPLLLSADVVLALLFLHYLRRTRWDAG